MNPAQYAQNTANMGFAIATGMFLILLFAGVIWYLLRNSRKDGDDNRSLLREVVTNMANSNTALSAIKDHMVVQSEALRGVAVTLNSFSQREDERHRTNEERAKVQMEMWDEITKNLGDVNQALQIHESKQRLKKNYSGSNMVPA